MEVKSGANVHSSQYFSYSISSGFLSTLYALGFANEYSSNALCLPSLFAGIAKGFLISTKIYSSV